MNKSQIIKKTVGDKLKDYGFRYLNVRVHIIILIVIMILVSALFFKINWTPGKYALKESELTDYKPYILIKEVHYTGTGWVQTGDDTGYFLPEEYIDIDLRNGSVLPQMEMYNEDYANTFLCKVEYKGKIEHAAFEKEIDSYYVTEWYPVYPVLRDTILPGWLYPKAFMTKQEAGMHEG